MKTPNPLISKTLRRLLAGAISLLILVTAVAFAETAAQNKHFSLESATQEVSQDPSRPALTVKEIAKQVSPSVVGISTEVTRVISGQTSPFDLNGFGYGSGRSQRPREYKSTGAGSGIIISADGYILTNHHVIDGATGITVTLNDGQTYPATLVASNAAGDVAVLKIEATGLTSATFGDSDTLEVGELAVAIGNPLGEINGAVSAGIISALNRKVTFDNGQEMTLVQTDAAINPGNSGGALINSFGEVIGLVNAKTASVQVEGLGYAIPVNQIKGLVEELVNNPQAAQAANDPDAIPVTGMALGVSVRDVTPELSKQYNLPEGVYIVEVAPFSAAEKAGIRSGDILVSLAGQRFTTTEALNAIKEGLTPGEAHEIKLIRNGQEMTLEITLGQAVTQTKAG